MKILFPVLLGIWVQCIWLAHLDRTGYGEWNTIKVFRRVFLVAVPVDRGGIARLLVELALVERDIRRHPVAWSQDSALELDLALINWRRGHGPVSVMMVRLVSPTKKFQPLSRRGLSFHIIPQGR